ncbi:MAG: phytanoyl-CoA dioxygenase family protein [Candidatus Sumerlaeaceae bacterium]
MLSQEQINFYRENGYLLVKGLFSKEEARSFRAEAHGIVERMTKRGTDIDATWGSAREAGGERGTTQILHCHDAQFQSAAFSRMIVDPRFCEAASEVMGTPNIELHHTKMFIKPPENGSPFPMHQDYHYFPHAKNSMIAAIIHLDDAPLEKGCLRVYPGSHKLGPLDQNPDGGWHLPAEKYSLEAATPLPGEAGDVIFFSYLTIHGSGLNVSPEHRTTILVQMREAGDEPTVETHRSRGQGMMLHGIHPTASPYMEHG